MLLLVIRHGKAEADSLSGNDSDRALTPRGEAQARWLGAELAARGFAPGMILCSDAVRARRTAELLREGATWPIAFETDLRVGRPVSVALRVIRSMTRVRTLAIVGHNPQLEMLVGVLTQGPMHDCSMRTGEAAVIELETSAEAVRAEPGAGRLLSMLRLDDER